MKTIYLDRLLENTGLVTHHGELHREVTGIAYDSRKVQENNVFVAIKGFKEDGLAYLDHALSRGCRVVVTEKTYPGERELVPGLTWLQVENDRQALSRLSAAFYGEPAGKLYNIGITGTNGKTTVMNLINSIFSQLEPTALIGTLGMDFEGLHGNVGLTTPEAADIHAFLAKVEDQGCRQLVMEASSVALELRRVGDIPFAQGIFTNFSGDHLDFHGTMDRYFASKMLLFRSLNPGSHAIVNQDDSRAGEILEQVKCSTITYGIDRGADVFPLSYKCTISGIEARITTPMGVVDVSSPLIGKVNLLNILAAVASAVAREIPMEIIAAGIGDFKGVKGRLDTAYRGDFTVLVDYAHTDNALESLLISLKEVARRRVILVFGAGGARDRTKRPRMGEAAAAHADFVVVTSDNPRTEEPGQIMTDIIAGFPGDFSDYLVEVDRKQAIAKALEMAQKEDIVVIAGKGHENYQIFKDKTIHFDDFEVVEEFMNKDKGVNNG